MTKAEIIAKFHLFMDDTSELSSQEESDLFDKIHAAVAADRPWEIYRKAFTGTQSTSVDYVALPSDFAYLLQNHNYTEDDAEAHRPVVFVGTSFIPYPVVNYGDRRQYRNKEGYAYIDIVNSRLVFTKQPGSAQSVEFDYSSAPEALELNESPAIPERFHDIYYHLMCVDDFIIQQSDKAKSYAAENRTRAADYYASMSLWNANLVQIN